MIVLWEDEELQGNNNKASFLFLQDEKLIEAIQHRSSFNDYLGLSLVDPIEGKTLREIIRKLFRYRDERFKKWLDSVEMYVLANRVTGMERGIYRVRNEEVQFWKPLDSDELVQLSTYDFKVSNLRTLPASIVFTADYKWLNERLGNYSYQEAHLSAGALSQYFCLQGSYYDWFVRPVRSFYEHKVDELLNLDMYTVPLYQLLIGKKVYSYLSYNMS